MAHEDTDDPELQHNASIQRTITGKLRIALFEDSKREKRKEKRDCRRKGAVHRFADLRHQGSSLAAKSRSWAAAAKSGSAARRPSLFSPIDPAPSPCPATSPDLICLDSDSNYPRLCLATIRGRARAVPKTPDLAAVQRDRHPLFAHHSASPPAPGATCRIAPGVKVPPRFRAPHA